MAFAVAEDEPAPCLVAGCALEVPGADPPTRGRVLPAVRLGVDAGRGLEFVCRDRLRGWQMLGKGAAGDPEAPTIRLVFAVAANVAPVLPLGE